MHRSVIWPVHNLKKDSKLDILQKSVWGVEGRLLCKMSNRGVETIIVEVTSMKRKKVDYGKYGYYFLIPFFLVYLLFQLYPLLYTFFLSFVESKQVNNVMTTPRWNNFENFVNVLSQQKFTTEGSTRVWIATDALKSIRQTLLIWIINFIPQILLSLLLAAWFTDTTVKLKGQGAYKVMMFLPNIITAASISVLFYSLFSNSGPVTIWMKNIGLISKSYNFMNSAAGTIGLIGFMQFWMWYGNTMIILIAGILGINPSLYEAAMVDGASGKQQFFSITLPLVRPILQYTLVTSAIGGLQMYDIPSLFNANMNTGVGQPNRASNTVTMQIRQYAFGRTPDYGKAAALSVILFICTLLISLIFFAATKERPPKQKHAVLKAGGEN